MLKINNRTIILSCFLLIILDQLVKFLIIKYYPHIITFNKGIFFGAVIDDLWVNIFLFLGVIVLYILFAKSEKNYKIPLLLIASGAFCNIIDRIFYLGVVDYINISWWSIFNLADVYIVIGAVWYLLKILIDKKIKLW